MSANAFSPAVVKLCSAFQLEQMKSEIEAAFIRHLKRGERIYLLAGMSIGIFVTKVLRRVGVGRRIQIESSTVSDTALDLEDNGIEIAP